MVCLAGDIRRRVFHRHAEASATGIGEQVVFGSIRKDAPQIMPEINNPSYQWEDTRISFPRLGQVITPKGLRLQLLMPADIRSEDREPLAI